MIFNELKHSFKKGSLLSRIIYINLAVFVFIEVLSVFFFLFNQPSYELINLVALPANGPVVGKVGDV